MAGGGQNLGQNMGQGGAPTAQGALGGNVQANAALQNIPQWQKGLLGIVTGDPRYGRNAPALHQLANRGIGMMGGGQGMPTLPGQPPQQAPQPMMGAQPMPGLFSQ